MRKIDIVIDFIKRETNLTPNVKLYLISLIDKEPEPGILADIDDKHQFTADLVDDSKCLCGEEWNTDVHN